MSDAAHFIFTRKAKRCTGNFFVDDEVLVSEVCLRGGLKRMR